jgi:hypothetical protein
MQYMSLSDLQRKLRINTENRFAVVVRIAARSELSNVAADKLLTFSGCPALALDGVVWRLYQTNTNVSLVRNELPIEPMLF